MNRTRLHGEFPTANRRQCALVADVERGALCGPHGEIVWLCAPRWHDDAIFSTLVGGSGGLRRLAIRCVAYGEITTNQAP